MTFESHRMPECGQCKDYIHDSEASVECRSCRSAVHARKRCAVQINETTWLCKSCAKKERAGKR